MEEGVGVGDRGGEGRGDWRAPGLCAPRVISNVPGCRDSTLMERVALTPAFTRQARRSSGIGERASFERLKWIHVVELYGWSPRPS